jgi:hypothetical protein
MGRRQVVRHWFLVPVFAGSIPADPAKLKRSAAAGRFNLFVVQILNLRVKKYLEVQIACGNLQENLLMKTFFPIM